MNRSRTIISAFASLALGSLMASPALGALSASPNPSTTGSYTVSGSVSTTRTYGWMSLIETAPGGTTADFDVADAGNISEAFSGKAVGTYTYRVQGCRYDLDEGNPERQEPIVICEDIGASLSVSVVSPPPADRMPDFATATVPAKSWTQNSAISSFTVPAATGGDTPLTYSASGLPAGVSMNASRSVSGTPGTAGMGTATVTVSDKDGDTDTLSFAWTVAADLTPTFGMSSVSAKSWKQNSAIATFTVPAASSGDAPLSHAASGLPAGVSMTSSRRVSGTPSAHGSGTATVTATDSDGDTDTLSFAWAVAEDLAPDFGDATVPAKSWTQNSAISSFTVPAATGGDTPLTYSASGLPAGVSMNASRSVSGTPGTAGMGTATVTVSDKDGDTDTLSFAWTVAADLTPTFGMSSVSAKSWKQNSAIATFTVPAASSGDAPLSYAASGLPAGVSMTSSRRVSGTPSGHGSGTATVTVSDKDGDTATLSFAWAVAEDLAPDFGDATVSYRSWAQNSAITAFTVPAASGGDAPLSYTISGLPAGLSMSGSREISGTPTASGVGAATVTVRDDDGDTDTLRFSWYVAADRTPTFGTATIADKTFKQNASITAFYVPIASGGNWPLSYSATGLPTGVSLANNRRVSGTPTAHGTGTATVKVTDNDGDTDTLEFDWTVNEDLAPSFATASVADKDWTLRTRIAAFTVPAASGGDGTLRYSASGLPSGVWMSSSTRRISGSPSGNDASSGTATVTTRDADGDTATLEFDWSVEDPMPDFGQASIPDKAWTQNTAISRFTAPAASGGNTPRRYSVSGLPAGISMSSLGRFSGTPTATGSGTATVTVTDYDGDTDSIEFDWTVRQQDLTPTFGASSVSARSWTQNAAIAAFTVPAATGGDAPLSHSASGLPAGVSMNASRSVSGTPTASGTGTATVTVSDKDGDTDTLSFAWTVAADLMPTFGASSVSARSWTQNAAIAAFTVPGATGGDGTLSYSATGLPAGLSLSAARQVSGTPTASGTGTATVTATDNDGDKATLEFTWSVAAEPTDEMPSYGSTAVASKAWKLNLAIAAFKVPAATGGDGTLSYSATGLPAGVSMSAARQVSGTPTASGSGTAIVTARDTDGDTDSVSFAWTVAADLRPSFGAASVGMQRWTANQSIAAFTVPAASRGDGTVTYTAIGLPYGVSMAASRQVSGKPLFASSGTATVTARDADGDTDTLSFSWSVAATDLMPTYSSASVAQPSWASNQAIVGFTIPAASSGNTPLSYTAAGLPVGVNMTAARKVAGTPTSVGTGTATVTVTDADGDTATFTFDWAVVTDDLVPTFGSATIQTQTWAPDKAIAAFTAPAAIGGNAPVVHGVNGLPEGVVMLDSMRVEGTPTAAGSGTATVAARDADGDIVKLSFTWTVSADSAPSFGTSTVSNQSWTAGQAITALTVPAATGGNGTLSYGVAGLPDGVRLSPTLQLSGTPLATGSGNATVTVRDADGDTDTLTFNWTVVSPDGSGTGTVLSVSPSPTTSANYTVSGAYTGTRSYIYFTLFETNPWGKVTPFHHASVPFSQSIANRVDGAYTYRLEGCYLKQYQNFPEAYEICETVGNTLSVTVDGPDPDPVGTQLGYTFQARKGDINGDSRMDLFIDRTSTATGGGVFQDVILQQTASGAFELVAPNASQTTTSLGWPTASVDLVLGDVNLDGFVDILVRGLASAIGVTDVLDQIVYAPGRAGGSPVILNAVDSTLTNFLSEVSNWTRNPAYFDNAMESVSVTRYRLARVCWEDEVVSENLERYCGWVKRPYTITVKRPSNSSPEAREFAGQFTVANGRIDSGIVPGNAQARTIDRILSEILGAPVLNGGLTSNCPTGGSIEGIPCEEDGLVGNLLFRAVEYIYVDVNNVPPNEDGSVDRNGNPTIQPGEYRFLTDDEKTILRQNGFSDLTDPNNPVDSLDLGEIKVFHHGRTVNQPVTYNKNRLYVWQRYPATIGMPQCNARERRELFTCYTDEFEGVEEATLLIHEATHVWQNEARMRRDIDLDEDLYDETYDYRQDARTIENKNFSCFTREQQAEMMSDLYRLRQNRNPRLPGNNSHRTMSNANRQIAIEQLEAVVPRPLPTRYTPPSEGQDPCAGSD